MLFEASVLALWLAVSWRFARKQELWMDETTQLSGLSLGPAEVVAWLLGRNADRFGGIPGDRMPPLSYWFGWLWAYMFGSSELSLRAFGLSLGAVALLLVISSANKIAGKGAAVVAGLTFALSSNVIVASVEIRPYPLFLLFSASACWFACQEAVGSESKWTKVGLIISLVAASYTHFYGLVLGCTTYGALMWHGIRTRDARLLKATIISILTTAGASLGLLPFVFGARSLRHQPLVPIGESKLHLDEFIRSIVRLLYRTLHGHPALSVHTPLMLIGLVGTIVCLGVAWFGVDQQRIRTRVLLLTVGVGFVAVIVAQFLTTQVDTLSPPYNLWMVPFLVVGASAAIAASARKRRWLGWSGAAMVLVANAGATLVLLENGSIFAHGPGNRLNAELSAAGSVSDTIVIHNNEGNWHHAYCPLRYMYGPRLRQFLASPGPDGTLELASLPEGRETTALEKVEAKRALLVTYSSQSAKQQSDFIRTGRFTRSANERLSSKFTEQGWKVVRQEQFMAQGAEEVSWLEPLGR